MAEVLAVAVSALELAAAGDACLEHASQVDRRRGRPLRLRAPHYRRRPGRPAARSRRPPSRPDRPAPRPRARGRRRGCARARGPSPACPGRRPGRAAVAVPSPGCGSCAPTECCSPAKMSSRSKPSPRASAATSATKTVHVWPRSGGPSLRAASRPNSTMSSTPLAIACSSRNEPVPALHTRFMSASTTRPFSTLMNLASWPPISTMERLRPPSGSSSAAAVACATISFWTTRRPPRSGEGGAEDGRRRVAAGAGEPDGDHRVGRHLRHLRDQRLRRLHGIALGAPVDARQHGARPELHEGGLRARRAQVEAEDGERVRGRPSIGRRLEPHDRARPRTRGLQPADAAARRTHQRIAVAGEADDRRRTAYARRGAPRRARPSRREAQRAERLEDAGLLRHVDRRVAEPCEAVGDRADERAVARRAGRVRRSCSCRRDCGRCGPRRRTDRGRCARATRPGWRSE